MTVLPDNVNEAWDNREGPIVFTTVDEHGKPNSIYASCVMKRGDDKIVVADNYFSKTRANILVGSRGGGPFHNKERQGFLDQRLH